MAQNAGICTLFEGDYHIGLAALVNSLHRAGYAGPIWAGYRGALPPWLDQLEKTDCSCAFRVGGTIKLIFVPIETETHFTNYKPYFMLDLLAGPARDRGYLWYFDPDILLRCNWSYFDGWQQFGIALCQDITNNILPSDSPLRRAWMQTAESIGLRDPRPLGHYFNGGLVGVAASQSRFLEMWCLVLGQAEKDGYDLKRFSSAIRSRELPFMQMDQDALNVAAMYTKCPLATMGPEAMGFVPGGFTLYHAVGPKPWRAKFLRRALGGVPSSDADKFFFTQVSSPIRVYSPDRLRLKRLACSMAALIGRFYRRG